MNSDPNQPFRLDFSGMKAIQQDYLSQFDRLLRAGGTQAASADRRFSGEQWTNSPLSGLAVSLYKLNAQTVLDMVSCVQADAKTQARLRFAAEQQIAACSPANFLALNPEAMQKALDTQGQSIALGLHNMLRDLRQGHVSMTDESQFEVGRNVASTEGAVVFENELFQLIEYKPITTEVYAKPFLVVPPCINKYYILDLQASNSMVRYLASQGHRTFIVSWRNADEALAHTTWDHYIEQGAITAVQTVSRLCKARQINALGFCVGGTILGTALAVLAARGKKPVASVTFLTTLLDFSDTGVLDLFVDEASVAMREAQFARGGILKGQELASTFSSLRPNELVWNYVVGNYLKGETPPPFDLLYWNSDATNLPGPMYAWYLRNAYLENNLKTPGACTVCGEKLDLSSLDLPTYVYGSREDHIVPIGSAYASTQLLPGAKRFVMGASGHIAGVINPPVANKRSFWVGKAGYFPPKVDDWIQQATQRPGSWWPDWTQWLQGHAGKKRAAPTSYAAKPIEPAPGRYVKARA